MIARLSGVAAVEAHEGVMQGVVVLALDVLVIDVFRNAVVDIQQGHRVAGQAGADVLAQRAVDIHFAGDRDTAGSQAAVDIAGLEAELGREGGPALVGKGHILPGALMSFRPVEQGQFKLGHAVEHVRIILAFAHFLGHIGGDFSDALVAGVLFVADQQVQLAVLFDFDAQLIQALDGGVAGEEVLGTGPEGDDLQVLEAYDDAGDRDELGDLVGQFFSGAYGIFRDIALQMAHAQVVGAVQHAAVSVAAAVDHVSVAFGGSHEHETSGRSGFRAFPVRSCPGTRRRRCSRRR